jgi:hypothetical protein
MQPGKPTSVAGEAGIDECRTIIAEMSKLKAGTTPGKSDEIEDGPQTPGSKAKEIEDIDGTPGMDEIVEMDIENHALDPVVLKARDLASSELVHVSVHTDHKTFAGDLKTRVLPSAKALPRVTPAPGHPTLREGLRPTCLLAHLSRYPNPRSPRPVLRERCPRPRQAIVFLDALTSKAKVILDLLKGLRDCMPKNVTLFIPVGRALVRLELAPAPVPTVWPASTLLRFPVDWLCAFGRSRVCSCLSVAQRTSRASTCLRPRLAVLL